MSAFDFERLDVYRASIEFITVSHAIMERLPRGRAYLVDQLQRASTSIALNIAEGAGEYSRQEKARFYRMSRRSAFECAAILDVMAAEHLVEPTELRSGRDLLERVGMMLTRMAVPPKRPDSDSGSDSDSGAAS